MSFKENLKLAQQGDPVAQFDIALMYDIGSDETGLDKAKAAEWYQKSAESGYVDAMKNLGLLYYTGEGVKQDSGRAMELWNLADKTEEENLNDIVTAIENDILSTITFEEASKRAEKGNPEAQWILGLMYFDGDTVERNVDKAVELYEKAASQGYINAIRELAEIHEEGIRVDRDAKTAVKWYSKGCELGDAFSQYNLGYLTENGIGTNKDKAKALKLYRLSAKQGFPGAVLAFKRMLSENHEQ